MTTERDLDTRLLAARGVREQDLPLLSAAFLDSLHASAGDEPADGEAVLHPAPAQVPASVLAARQLVADAHERGGSVAGRSRRRPPRRVVLRLGGALLAVAAVGIATVVVTSPGKHRAPVAGPAPTAGQTQSPPGPVDPPGGLDLVAAEAVTFPYSLDPAPAGLTPELTKAGGISPFGPDPVVWMATFGSDQDAGFTFAVASANLREQGGGGLDQHDPDQVRETGSVQVNGISADFVRGQYSTPDCRYAPSSPAQTDEPGQLCRTSFADLAWRRPDGQWAYVWSEDDAYSNIPALVSVAESIVDRPQPVRLQVGLSPEGWSVSAYENGGLTLISETDPSISNRIAVSVQERWRGYDSPRDVLKGMSEGNPVEHVTVQGRRAELVSVPDHFTGPGFPDREEPRRKWYLAAELPDGVLFLFEAPDTLSREDVLAMAERITYTP
jgi:hypothetical protein